MCVRRDFALPSQRVARGSTDRLTTVQTLKPFIAHTPRFQPGVVMCGKIGVVTPPVSVTIVGTHLIEGESGERKQCYIQNRII